MNENYDLDGCWIINVPAPKYGYSFAVYIGECNASEQEVIELAYANGLFDYGYSDVEIANAVQMTDYDYPFWKDNIQDISE